MAKNTNYDGWNWEEVPSRRAARVERDPNAFLALIIDADIPDGCFFGGVEGYYSSSRDSFPLSESERAMITLDVERAVGVANEFLKPENRRCVKKGRE